MKATKLLLSIVFIYALIILPSCKGNSSDPGEEESEAERVTKLISGNWKMKSVSVDGVTKDLYKDLAITFTATGFSATNGSTVWPAQGTWSFGDASAKSFTRSDQTVVSIDAIDANNLTLSLTWTQTTVGPGRSQALAGKHVFVMGK